MNDKWYDDDTFWEQFGPVLFDKQRLSNTGIEVDRITALLQIEEPVGILDLCCGIGRHSLELARRGHEVVGVDRTSTYIDQARFVAEQNSLDVEFVIGDMREYCVPNRFQRIVNLFGSFSYFADPKDDRKVVANMYMSLRPGGKFLIETQGKEILARDFEEREWSEEGDLLLLSEKQIEEDWKRVHTRWIVVDGEHRFEHRVSVRLYSAVELTSVFNECGFHNVNVYGNLAGSAYDNTAQRLVVVGEK